MYDRLYEREAYERLAEENGGEPVDWAPKGLLYIRIRNGKFYVGKTTTNYRTARYSKDKSANESLIDFIGGVPEVFNNTKGTQTLLHDLENAILKLNENADFDNKDYSRSGGDLKGSIFRGEKWLDENIPDWRERFDYTEDDPDNY